MTSATDNRMTELLPCPFCGGEAQVQHQSRELYGDAVDWYGVYCKKQFCGYVSGQSTEAEAIAAWNTRTHGTLTAEQVRELIAPHLHARPTFDFGRHGAVWRADFQAIADELNAMLCGGRVNEDSIDKWLREFQIAHGELAHIGPDELKDLAFALHDDIPLGYEASMRLGQWLLNAELGSERDEIYNAGFDNGVKATLQQLEDIMNDKWSSSLTKVENIEEWIAEQWKEYEL